MNIATIVFGLIIIFFLWRGYQQGFIKSIARILSWLIAYPAAIFFTIPLAKLIVKYSSLDGLIVYFIAGSAIFLTVSFLVTKLLDILSDTIPDNTVTENTSKVGGAVIGIIVGGVMGLLAVYAINLTQKPASKMASNIQPASYSATESSAIDDPHIQTKITNTSTAGDPPESFIESSAQKLVATAAATAIDLTLQDPAATQLTKAFAGNPQSMLGNVQQLANNEDVKKLFNDPNMQELLNKGDTNALIANKEFQHLMNNADMQAILVHVEDGQAGKTSQHIAAEKMVAAWQRMDAIKNDPRVVGIITDPAFQQQLNSSNKLPLLMNPNMKVLAEIIFSQELTRADNTTRYEIKDLDNNSQGSIQPRTLETNTSSSEEQSAKKIYRWTDKNGKVHYSDQPVID